MLLKIVFKNIWQKRLSSLLSIVLMAFGIGIILLILNLNRSLEKTFFKNIKGIDMVVGAKGSPLQLILSSVFQMDNPTGNINIKDVNALKLNPLIKKTISLSMGDNYKGYRIIGTDKSYVEHFEGKIEKGKLNTADHEIIIGNDIATKENIQLNQTIESAHGLDAEGEKHEEHGLKVVGILKPNASVIDKLIICNLNTINELHHTESDSSAQITAALIKFRSPLGLMTIPRNINSNTNMMAALPSIEINRLFELLGIGIQGLKFLAWAIIFISGISVFISMYNNIKDRKYEIALMLSMGATRFKLWIMLILESIILAICGFITGYFFCYLGLFLSKKYLNNNIGNLNFGFSFQKEEIYLLIGALLVGIFAALIPSLGIYKLNIAKTLAKD